MARFVVSNKIVKEFFAIVEAESASEAVEKFYDQDYLMDLGQIEDDYDERGYKEELRDEYIDTYCDENGVARDDLVESDYIDIIKNYM